MTWNKEPIHIVFYVETPRDKLEKIVEAHCAKHATSTKNMCMSMVDLCIQNDKGTFVSCKGDAGDIIS
jgi:hypothetical protein